MRQINLLQPGKISFGLGCIEECVEDIQVVGLQRVFIVTSSPILGLVEPLVDKLRKYGMTVEVNAEIDTEPTIGDYERVLADAQQFEPEIVIGFGGGSSMDVAKLVAALHDSSQLVCEVLGIDFLKSRNTRLICIPTTAGTGSEVSPNAILLDETDQLKKGAVSPFLVPDAAYVDPVLTYTLPPSVTAATGMDAMTHCIEAFANKFAHPIVDQYALKGIELISTNLVTAVKNGKNPDAREAVVLGSLYGGLCLGPVNTAAVHALAYPLGGEFHVAHGVSNSVLLPHVIEFNLSAAPERYAKMAIALGAKPGTSDEETASQGLAIIRGLSAECGIPAGLEAFGITKDAIPRMAESAIKVTRLLKNNLREVTLEDAADIYEAAFS